MDISQTTEHVYIASRIKGADLEAVLQLDPGLIISMIVQRRPPKALAAEGLEVLWLRIFDFPFIPIPLRSLQRGVEAARPPAYQRRQGRPVAALAGRRRMHQCRDAVGQPAIGWHSLCLYHAKVGTMIGAATTTYR